MNGMPMIGQSKKFAKTMFRECTQWSMRVFNVFIHSMLDLLID